MVKHTVCEYVSSSAMQAVVDGNHVWLLMNLADTSIPGSAALRADDSINPPSGCEWVGPTDWVHGDGVCVLIFCRVRMESQQQSDSIVPMLSVARVWDAGTPIGRLMHAHTGNLIGDCVNTLPEGMAGYDLVGVHTKGMDNTTTRHVIHARDSHAWVIALTTDEANELGVRHPESDDEWAVLEDARDGYHAWCDLAHIFLQPGSPPPWTRRLVQEYIKQTGTESIPCDKLRVLRSIVPEGNWGVVEKDQHLYVASQLARIPERFLQSRCVYIDPCFSIGLTQSKMQTVNIITSGRRVQSGGEGLLAKCLDTYCCTGESVMPWVTLTQVQKVELSHSLGKNKKRGIRKQMSGLAEIQSLWAASYILMQLHCGSLNFDNPILCASFGLLTSRQTLHGVLVDRSWHYAVKLPTSSKRSCQLGKKYKKRKIRDWSDIVAPPVESRVCIDRQSQRQIEPAPVELPELIDILADQCQPEEDLDQFYDIDQELQRTISLLCDIVNW